MAVILFMATTVNGIIAREDGSEDFLSDINWETFSELAKEIGCFIVGRKTYDAVQKWEDYTFDDIDAKKIIVSKNPDLQLQEGYIIASSPSDAIEKAASAGFENVLLTGGGKLNSIFIQSGLVNEVILNIESAILGKGIKLFEENDFETKLELVDTKTLESNIVQLHYKVVR